MAKAFIAFLRAKPPVAIHSAAGPDLFLLAAVLASLSGCSPAAPKVAEQPLRVAFQNWPGTYWLCTAGEKGWFKEAGLNVQLVDTSGNCLDSVKAFAEGRLDAYDVVLFDLLVSVAHGTDLVGVIDLDYSYGADKLVARPGIEHLSDLKGKRVALPRGSYLEYIFEVAIGRNGLAPKDVQVVNLAAEKAPEALIKGDADAMLTFEPYASQGLEAVHGHNLFDTSQLPGLVPTLMVFPRQLIEQRRDEAAAFVKVWRRTTSFIEEHPEAAFRIVATVNKRPLEEVRRLSQLDRILGRRDNELAFSFAGGFDSLHGAVRQVNDYMIDKGITDQKLDSSRCLDGTFIRALQ